MPDHHEFPLYFKKPEYIPELSAQVNLMVAMGAMSSRLANEERTRLHHPDGRPENVAEHAHMAARVGVYLAREYYPHLDAGKVAIKLIIHDDPEAYIQDTATDRITEQGRLEKKQREAFGLEVLVREHAPLSPNYVDDMTSYEELEGLEDEFANAVDKITTLLAELAHGGESLRVHYSPEEFLFLTADTEERMKKRCPNFPELGELRTELAMYMFEKYYTSGAGDSSV